jgi:hypothetical protein
LQLERDKEKLRTIEDQRNKGEIFTCPSEVLLEAIELLIHELAEMERAITEWEFPCTYSAAPQTLPKVAAPITESELETKDDPEIVRELLRLQ